MRIINSISNIYENELKEAENKRPTLVYDEDFGTNTDYFNSFEVSLHLLDVMDSTHNLNLFLEGLDKPKVNADIFYTLLRCIIENKEITEEHKQTYFNTTKELYKINSAFWYVSNTMSFIPDWNIDRFIFDVRNDLNDDYPDIYEKAMKGDITYDEFLDEIKTLNNRVFEKLNQDTA
ncbi:hypothetical protein ACXA18_00775 [Riemerella anatipestifer]|uniref:hypothetical protein n=1 Tax=Riemerella anatipestifer TaxID=34085 RepID=UPI0007EC54EE|nr:hypothetical protein [Riemerella anatipestifer]AZZ57835.1 hypothetical protein AWB57_01570 [Riemerella anatipestifer]MCD5968563.1 hypothetical protein [Riemerella anatipestifer]MCU7540345.1 hypothetical protein [Riemerella anatipestifer]MCU7571038.1 hypothetical protein [Riemerella anatipestifer]MCU7597685.1 hypothetical protein [Riemerella anatipestifer]